MTTEKYYLKADHQTEWGEVTREQFISAEQAAGFRSKFGPDHPATGGFTGGGMRGRIEYVTEQPRPEQAIDEDLAPWPCAIGEHDACQGEAQLTRIGPLSKCGCDCHKPDDAPAAPEQGETNAGQVKALAANWNQKSRLEQIMARHQMHDLSGLPNREYAASWEDVKLLIEQHSALIAQRERLLATLREILTEVEFVGDAKAPFTTWIAEKIRPVLTTIEQEGTRQR